MQYTLRGVRIRSIEPISHLLLKKNQKTQTQQDYLIVRFLLETVVCAYLCVVMHMKANGVGAISNLCIFTICARVCHGRPSISKQPGSRRGTWNSGVNATRIHTFNG